MTEETNIPEAIRSTAEDAKPDAMAQPARDFFNNLLEQMMSRGILDADLVLNVGPALVAFKITLQAAKLPEPVPDAEPAPATAPAPTDMVITPASGHSGGEVSHAAIDASLGIPKPCTSCDGVGYHVQHDDETKCWHCNGSGTEP